MRTDIFIYSRRPRFYPVSVYTRRPRVIDLRPFFHSKDSEETVDRLWQRCRVEAIRYDTIERYGTISGMEGWKRYCASSRECLSYTESVEIGWWVECECFYEFIFLWIELKRNHGLENTFLNFVRELSIRNLTLLAILLKSCYIRKLFRQKLIKIIEIVIWN